MSKKSKVNVVRIKYLDDLSFEELRALADEMQQVGGTDNQTDAETVRRYAVDRAVLHDRGRSASDELLELRSQVLEILHWRCIGVPVT